MFCSKRNSLVKRLWKYRINDETKGSSQKDTSSSSTKKPSSSQEDLELKSVTHSFFKRLPEDQLKILLQAMESKGGEVTPCVLVSKSDLCIGRRMVSPYVLCCRVFRWPDLKSDVEMKRLPSCTQQNGDKEAVICCNPYHWSLVVKIDEPPIHPDKLLMPHKQSQRVGKDEKREDGDHRIMKCTESGIMSSVNQDGLTDNAEQSSGYDCLLWCTIAYWELRERVGRLFSVTEPSVHIFQHLPHGDGVCLRLFQKPTNLEVVKRTREKIGFGIILSREAAHQNNINLARTFEMVTAGDDVKVSALAAGIVVSPLLPSSSLLSSSTEQFSLLSRPEEGARNRQAKNVSSFPTTSNSKIVSSSQRRMLTVECDNLDVVHDPGGGGGEAVTGFDGKMIEYQHNDADGSVVHNQSHLQEEQQHFCCRHSPHISCISNETTPGTCTPSLQFFNQSHRSESISLSTPSSSLFSSSSSFPSPSSSHPMYINDTSVNCSHHSSSGSNLGSWVVSNVPATHITNINQVHNFICSNNKSHSDKKSTTDSFTECSKNSRTMGSHTTSSTAIAGSTSNTSTTSSFTSVSSGLPCKQGEVWAYNASNFPIFVNSPTLDDPQSPRTLVVKKVPPGYSIKIFDYARAELLERTEARSILLNDGPFDPCSVRISLAKGWGPSYSRQFITSCPCWLEVLLGVRRHSSTS